MSSFKTGLCSVLFAALFAGDLANGQSIRVSSPVSVAISVGPVQTVPFISTIRFISSFDSVKPATSSGQPPIPTATVNPTSSNVPPPPSSSVPVPSGTATPTTSPTPTPVVDKRFISFVESPNFYQYALSCNYLLQGFKSLPNSVNVALKPAAFWPVIYIEKTTSVVNYLGLTWAHSGAATSANFELYSVSSKGDWVIYKPFELSGVCNSYDPLWIRLPTDTVFLMAFVRNIDANRDVNITLHADFAYDNKLSKSVNRFATTPSHQLNAIEDPSEFAYPLTCPIITDQTFLIPNTNKYYARVKPGTQIPVSLNLTAPTGKFFKGLKLAIAPEVFVDNNNDGFPDVSDPDFDGVSNFVYVNTNNATNATTTSTSQPAATSSTKAKRDLEGVNDLPLFERANMYKIYFDSMSESSEVDVDFVNAGNRVVKRAVQVEKRQAPSPSVVGAFSSVFGSSFRSVAPSSSGLGPISVVPYSSAFSSKFSTVTNPPPQSSATNPPPSATPSPTTSTANVPTPTVSLPNPSACKYYVDIYLDTASGIKSLRTTVQPGCVISSWVYFPVAAKTVSWVITADNSSSDCVYAYHADYSYIGSSDNYTGPAGSWTNGSIPSVNTSVNALRPSTTAKDARVTTVTGVAGSGPRTGFPTVDLGALTVVTNTFTTVSPTNNPSAGPNFVSAQFDSTGSFIDLTFDTTVAVVVPGTLTFLDQAGSFPCEFIVLTRVSGNVLARDKFPDDCSFRQTSGSTFRLAIKGIVGQTEATVGVQAPITLRTNAVYKRFSPVQAAVGSRPISAPASPPIPSVVIRGSAIIDACPDVVLGFVHLGNAGRVWDSVTINVTTSVNDTTDANLKVVVESLQSELRRGATTLTLQKNAFVPRSYKLTFTFTNFLGGSASFDFSFTKLAGADVPNVVVRAPPGTLDANFGIPVIAQVVPSACGSNLGGVDFTWKSTQFKITDRNKGAIYIIDPNTLSAGQSYNISVDVGFAGSKNKYTFYTTITTKSEVLQVFSGRNDRIRSTDNYFVVPTVRNGYRPEPFSNLNCSWTCTSLTTSSACLTAANATYAPASTCVLPITNGTFAPGTYKLTMTATKNSVNFVGAPAYLEVLGQAFLNVTLNTTEPKTSAQSKKFALIATVTTNVPFRNLNFSWSSESSCFGDTYPTITLNSTTLLSPPTSSVLKLSPGALSPGLTYCFKVSVSDGTITGSATSLAYVYSGPSSGSCSISGNGVVTAFTEYVNVTCTGWITDTDSYPIYYEYLISRLAAGNYSDYVYLKSLTDESTLSTTLLPGKYKVKVNVIDSNESKNTDDISFLVRTSDTSARRRKRAVTDAQAVTALSQINSSYASFNTTGDAATALQTISLNALSLKDATGTTAELSVLAALIPFLNAVAFSSNTNLDINNAAIISDALASMVGTAYYLTVAQAQTILRILHQTVSSAFSSGTTLSTCFSDTAAKSQVTVMDGILGSLSKLGVYDSFIANQIFNTTTVMDNCLARLLTCKQNPYSMTNSYYNHSVGIDDTTSQNTFCSYTFSNSSSVLGTSSCFQYGCYSYDSKGVNTNTFSSPLVGGSTVLTTLNFSSSSVVRSTTFASTDSVVFSVTLPTSFLTANNLTTYTVGGSNPTSLHQFNPVCAYVSGTGYSTSGCSVVSLSGSTLSCNCTSLQKFAAGLTSNSGSTTASTSTTATPTTTVLPTLWPITETGSSTNVGAIVGGVIGGVAGLAIIGGLVYYFRFRS